MKLVIGGAYQGKARYLTEHLRIPADAIVSGADSEGMRKLRTDGENSLTTGRNKGRGSRGKVLAVNQLHLYIRKCLQEGFSQEEILREVLSWLEESPEMVIVCDELGCGIVPMEAFEREYREVTGRICCVLAGKAEQVIRVCCGIGTVIKPREKEAANGTICGKA